ncbi:hypothetical protein ABZ208_23760 [Streptomyces sp. NPDC006208]|uniref:hypothetical protein n=1 Tax=Streptomyces sp. NPDC006208 TaxID=3156734 RepID=UPI0033AF1969
MRQMLPPTTDSAPLLAAVCRSSRGRLPSLGTARHIAPAPQRIVRFAYRAAWALESAAPGQVAGTGAPHCQYGRT